MRDQTVAPVAVRLFATCVKLALDMPDYPAEWHHALEILARSATGCSASLLAAHGFRSGIIAGLVDCGFATITTERTLVGHRLFDMAWFMITDRGRAMLEK